MAQEIIGQVVPTFQELFLQEDGLSRFLEAVIQQAMSLEVQGHLQVQSHERTAVRAGYRDGYLRAGVASS